MNGYICFHVKSGKKLEIMADTSYDAQKIAARQMKVKKSYEVTVVLAEKNGEQVTHKPTF